MLLINATGHICIKIPRFPTRFRALAACGTIRAAAQRPGPPSASGVLIPEESRRRCDGLLDRPRHPTKLLLGFAVIQR